MVPFKGLFIICISCFIYNWNRHPPKNSKRQSEATNLIIKAATEIYDKTRLVGDAFEDFERSLEQANKSIDSGKKRTKNLVNKVEKMRTIGGLEPTKDISDTLRIIDKE